MDPAAEKSATDQVWARLSQELVEDGPANQKILGHEDFEALIPAFVKGELSDAKAMLLQDHVGECVPCRRALKTARTGGRPKPAAVARAPRSAAAVWGWRVAAAAIVVVALIGLDIKTDLFTIQAEGLIQIERVHGKVFQVTGHCPGCDAELGFIGGRLDEPRTCPGCGTAVELVVPGTAGS